MDKNSKKYFFTSMILCFFIIFLFTGFVIVEKNVQSIISSESISFLSYNFNDNNKEKFLKLHFMGQDFVFNFK